MSLLQLAVPTGTRIAELSEKQRSIFFNRGRAKDPEVIDTVSKLIDDVRKRGDAGLRDQARFFDDVDDLTIEVPRALWRNALEKMNADVRDGLRYAAENIAT